MLSNKQEKRLALVCFVVAAIMLYGTVKALIRFMHYFS